LYSQQGSSRSRFGQQLLDRGGQFGYLERLGHGLNALFSRKKFWRCD
jgi:hypothetical protein